MWIYATRVGPASIPFQGQFLRRSRWPASFGHGCLKTEGTTCVCNLPVPGTLAQTKAHQRIAWTGADVVFQVAPCQARKAETLRTFAWGTWSEYGFTLHCLKQTSPPTFEENVVGSLWSVSMICMSAVQVNSLWLMIFQDDWPCPGSELVFFTRMAKYIPTLGAKIVHPKTHVHKYIIHRIRWRLFQCFWKWLPGLSRNFVKPASPIETH